MWRKHERKECMQLFFKLTHTIYMVAIASEVRSDEESAALLRRNKNKTHVKYVLNDEQFENTS